MIGHVRLRRWTPKIRRQGRHNRLKLFAMLVFTGIVACASFASHDRFQKMTILVPTWTASYALYHQPHAIWLDRYDSVGANLPQLKRVLHAALKAGQRPELVVYSIPLRDLGQSSEGGFSNAAGYLADNRRNAREIKHFIQKKGLAPVIYIEPDSLPLSVQYRRDNHDNAESLRIYKERIDLTRQLITLYKEAGALVYLDAGHSGWFDYGDTDIQRIADALNEAGIEHANGLVSNVSNRQPVWIEADQRGESMPNTEAHYLKRLLPLLKNPHLDVRVDTSRNGGTTKARQYTLDGWHYTTHNDNVGGWLLDNENRLGRRVGRWERRRGKDIVFQPFFGKNKVLTHLLVKEKYTFNPQQGILNAPPWLDAVGDVQPGPAPTDTPPANHRDVIARYRYVKPPDDCDGALNYPAGESKKHINDLTNEKNKRPPENR